MPTTYDDPLAFLDAQTAEGGSAADAGRLPTAPLMSAPSIHTGPAAALDMLAQLGREGAQPGGVDPESVARPVVREVEQAAIYGDATDFIASGQRGIAPPTGAPGREAEDWARTAPAPREEE